MMCYTFALLFILPCVFGQQLIDRECQDYPITTEHNFNFEEYLGRWHELMRYETSMQMNGECVTATYSLNSNQTMRIFNQMQRNGETFSIEGYAVETNPGTNDGKLQVKIPGSGGNYWILQTDYDNYSVVWSCYNQSGKSRQFLWVLARETTVTNEVKADIESVLMKNELDASLLKPTNNDDKLCGF